MLPPPAPLSSHPTMSSVTLPIKKEGFQHSDEGVPDDTTTIEGSEPPNGGLLAWLQVLGAFFLWFNTW